MRFFDHNWQSSDQSCALRWNDTIEALQFEQIAHFKVYLVSQHKSCASKSLHQQHKPQVMRIQILPISRDHLHKRIQITNWFRYDLFIHLKSANKTQKEQKTVIVGSAPVGRLMTRLQLVSAMPHADLGAFRNSISSTMVASMVASTSKEFSLAIWLRKPLFGVGLGWRTRCWSWLT